jgi:predicted nucleotidyltransferase
MPPTTSPNSVKIISLNRDKLLVRLRDIAAQIRSAHPQVVGVRLFGSVARGDCTGTSDVDVLVVLRHTAEPDPVRRILTFLPYFTLDRGADLLVYTEAELERGLAENPALQRIWSESISLNV